MKNKKMVLRFFKLNPLERTLISRTISSYNANCNRYPQQNPILIQALNSPFFNYPITNPENPSFNFPKRWHMGHSGHHHHHHHDKSTDEEGEKIFRLGLAADITLATGKALTGYLSGSTAIIADAAHSLSDVVLSGVALLSFKASRVPKDKEHPYGHGKFETLGALGISGVLIASAGGIAWHALDILGGVLSAAPDIVSQSAVHQHTHSHHDGGHHHGIDMDHPVLALNMTVVAIAVKEGLYWITKRAGERTGSGLMKANAWHHRADAISSVVALLGVGGSILGVKFLDPLAGLVVSGMILKAGVETGYQSVLELVDAAIPSYQLEPIKQTIRQVEGVEGCNHLRGRRAGSSLYLDVSIEVNPVSSIGAAHEVGENVRRQIQKFHPEVSEVFIHLEPSKLHFPPTIKHQEENAERIGFDSATSEHKEIEEIISNMLADKYSERMVIQSIKRHALQDKVKLQITASIPPDTSLREAKQIEEEAKEHISEILQATCDTVQVLIQFQFGDVVVQFESRRTPSAQACCSRRKSKLNS